MRPSAWVPQLPRGWTWTKLGAKCSVKARLGWKGLKADEYVESGFIFLSTPNIKGRDIDYTNVNYITSQRYFESPEIMLAEGDVLMAKDGSTLGTVNVVRCLPAPATVNSSLAVIRPLRDTDGRFLMYFLASHVVQSYVHRMKDGMGVPHLFQADLRKFDVVCPPVHVQRAIADYLDRKTAAIDALIAKKERLLETLTERWLAFVGRAVTLGLDAPSALKETGIAVLPREIPAHWTALRLKRLLLRLEQGWSPDCFSRPAEEGEWGVLKAGAVNSGLLDESENKALPPDVPPLPEYEVREGDLLMSRASGSRRHIGAAGLVGPVRERLLLCDKLYRLRLRAKLLDRQFARWALRAPYVRSQIGLAATGQSTLQNIGQDDVGDIWFVLPPLREQEAIAVALAHEESAHSELTRLLERQVAHLREYRQALITAAVTGQLDFAAQPKEAA